MNISVTGNTISLTNASSLTYGEAVARNAVDACGNDWHELEIFIISASGKLSFKPRGHFTFIRSN